MKLYEILGAIDKWFYKYEDLKDEQISKQAWDELAALECSYDEKLGNIGRLLKNLAAESEAIRAEEVKLKDRRWSVESRIERLKQWLGIILGGQKWSDGAIAFSFRRSEAVVVEDESKLPPQYWREKIVREVDKEGLKIALKNSGPIPGARLEQRENLQVK